MTSANTLPPSVLRCRRSYVRDTQMALDTIIAEVCSFYGVRREDMVGHKRPAHLCWARHVIYWLLRQYTTLSLPEIGSVMDRDHGSILHGERRVQDMIEAYPVIGAEVEELNDHLWHLLSDSINSARDPHTTNNNACQPKPRRRRDGTSAPKPA